MIGSKLIFSIPLEVEKTFTMITSSLNSCYKKAIIDFFNDHSINKLLLIFSILLNWKFKYKSEIKAIKLSLLSLFFNSLKILMIS